MSALSRSRMFRTSLLMRMNGWKLSRMRRIPVTALRLDLKDEWHTHVSKTYQWLPTDFTVSAQGDVIPDGYINNLHHRALYHPITSTRARFAPLFERLLGHALSPDWPHAIDIDPSPVRLVGRARRIGARNAER